jgi:hypothetical protein
VPTHRGIGREVTLTYLAIDTRLRRKLAVKLLVAP